MPLNTADVSLDATFDNVKSSLDTIIPMGQDLLCLKRETDKLAPIEPAVISEKAELLVRSHTFRSKRFRDIAIFRENVVGVTRMPGLGTRSTRKNSFQMTSPKSKSTMG